MTVLTVDSEVVPRTSCHHVDTPTRTRPPSPSKAIELDTLGEDRIQTAGLESIAYQETRPTDKGSSLRASIRFFAVCWTKFLNGWNDGTTGPLIPKMQAVYHVNFIVVSLVFILACVGFLTGAFLNVSLSDRFGFGKVLLFGSLCHILVFTLQCIPGLPFGLFVALFALNGVGMSLEDAQSVTYVASLENHPDRKMMLLQASYGAGAFTAPLFHYLTSLSVAVVNTAAIWCVFRGKTQDECLAQIGQPPGDRGTSEHSKIRQILSIKTVHLLAAFALVYVGAEVTVGGWIVTFIQTVRDGGPSSGYIFSGFFGGLMVGRLVLLFVNQKPGANHLVRPALIGGAVAVSFVGFVLGPMYPIIMSYAGRVLPRWLLTGSIGWIGSLGQAGSAFLPFVTGAVAQKAGIASLQPLVVGMLVVMLGLWALVPKSPRRED
ncbi:major facilitator superfamily domain-containing protein [Mucidula mucida]|nr:major facilitator superfamily domain-containing protein [Mucidula mucida]